MNDNIINLYNLEKEGLELMEHVLGMCRQEDNPEMMDATKAVLLLSYTMQCMVSFAKFQGDTAIPQRVIKECNDILKYINKGKNND